MMLVHFAIYVGYSQQYTAPGMSAYNTRQQETTTLVQPSGRYEREVKQATYSIQSTDSKLSPLSPQLFW